MPSDARRNLICFSFQRTDHKVCSYLADNNINILDISQTIIDGYFNMMMIVDANRSAKSTEELVSDLKALGEEIGVVIRCQHEDIFNKMHRI